MSEEKELVAVPLEKNTTLAGLIATYTEQGRAGDAAAHDAQQAELEAEARPLLDEAKSIATKHGILRAKHMARAQQVLSSDWAALYKSVPADMKFDERTQRMISTNHEALWRLQQAAADVVGSAGSTLGDSTPSNGYDAYSLANAAEQAEAALKFSPRDPIHGTPSAAYRRALVQLRWWLGKSRAVLESTERAIERFKKYEAEVHELLANIAPQSGAPSARKAASIPTLPPTPPAAPGGTSFQEFDVFAQDAPKTKDSVEVTAVGAGDGHRAKGR